MKKTISALAIFALFSASAAHAAIEDLNNWNQVGNVFVDNGVANLTADSWISKSVSGINSFQWNFVAKDYMPFNDYAYFSLNDGGEVTLSNVAAVGNYGTSGWNTYTFSSPFSGILKFGVNNAVDSEVPSQLFIQNVSPVPEPETYAMMLAGLAIVGAFARRKSKAV